MKYIVYLTTNLKSQINGINRIYIGVHKTENPEVFDGYLGCATYSNIPSSYKYPKTPFQYAVKKYGPDAFRREILYVYDDKKSAYLKEAEIVDLEFIKQDHVYNAALGGDGNLGKPLYQFDLQGNLIKVWEYRIEAYEFYGLPREKFNYAIYDKHVLLDSLWSNTDAINITDYVIQTWGEPKVTYLYSKNGKLISEFISRKECAKYIDTTEERISASIKRNSLIKSEYYVSDSLVDVYVPKARKQLTNTTFYIYRNYEYFTTCIGKELMNILGIYSWSNIRDRLRSQNRWIKDFYISEEEIQVENIPPKKIGNGVSVDVYTKFGNFIETLFSVKEVKEKYKIKASDIKNIQLGDKYIGDYIFKYHTSKL